MLIIPAVDIKGGRAVRLRQGRADEETVFGDDPIEMAVRWQDEGAEYLHVVDLDGAFEGKPRNLQIVKKILGALNIPVEVGGGIRDEETISVLLETGADRVIIGTRAVESVLWVTEIAAVAIEIVRAGQEHPGRIAVGIDAREGMVATHGWVRSSSVTPLELAKVLEGAPLTAYIYTDVLRDGTNTGPNIHATGAFAHGTKVPVIASGGVSSLDDIRQLAQLDLLGIIIGRALYDNRFTLAQAIDTAR